VLLGLAALLLRSPLSETSGWPAGTIALAGALPFCVGLGVFVGEIAAARLDTPRWMVIRAALLSCIVLIALVLVALYVTGASLSDRTRTVAMVAVALFSGAIGFGELTQRYRDDPSRLFVAAPTIAYIAVNMAAAIAAYGLIREFNVFGDLNPAHRDIYEIMLAGFGSIAFFRSSFFTARVGDKDFDVGPSTLLKSFLDASDRMINRSQAEERLTDVGQIMARVTFRKRKPRCPRSASRWSRTCPVTSRRKWRPRSTT
jgi:hypothetical protein